MCGVRAIRRGAAVPDALRVSVMVIRKDTHVVIDLNSVESALLKDLLRVVSEQAEDLGPQWERFRMDLLYSLPAEET